MYCIRLEGQGEDDVDIFYQVMVYSNTKASYEKMMEELPSLFQSFGAEEEYLTDDLFFKWKLSAMSRTSAVR